MSSSTSQLLDRPASSDLAARRPTGPGPGGRVYWITGLPGSGKTTIAHALRHLLPTALVLDGDELREVLGATRDHDPDARRRLAYSYARLARLLARQGADVIVATVSMFEDVREWNRAEQPDYLEVFIDAPRELRHARRALYAERGDTRIEDHPAYELPRRPDLSLFNDGRYTPDELAARILAAPDRTPGADA